MPWPELTEAGKHGNDVHFIHNTRCSFRVLKIACDSWSILLAVSRKHIFFWKEISLRIKETSTNIKPNTRVYFGHSFKMSCHLHMSPVFNGASPGSNHIQTLLGCMLLYTLKMYSQGTTKIKSSYKPAAEA